MARSYVENTFKILRSRNHNVEMNLDETKLVTVWRNMNKKD